MANYGGEQHMKQDGHNKTDDQYVQNPLHSTTAGHEKGNTGTNTTGHGIGSIGNTMGGGAGHGCEEGKHGGPGGILPRSGSGSSSSSEDDGEGGRRKKGVMEKVKEKLPGGQRGGDKQCKTSAPTTTIGAGGGHGYEGDQEQEKKGMMGKIKEKLPGGKQ